MLLPSWMLCRVRAVAWEHVRGEVGAFYWSWPMDKADLFRGAGRFSYALVDSLAQEPGRMPLHMRLFFSILPKIDHTGRLRESMESIFRGLSSTNNRTQLYKAIHILLNRDWLRRDDGTYYVNPTLFFRGTFQNGGNQYMMALDRYQALPGPTTIGKANEKAD